MPAALDSNTRNRLDTLSAIFAPNSVAVVGAKMADRVSRRFRVLLSSAAGMLSPGLWRACTI